MKILAMPMRGTGIPLSSREKQLPFCSISNQRKSLKNKPYPYTSLFHRMPFLLYNRIVMMLAHCSTMAEKLVGSPGN